MEMIRCQFNAVNFSSAFTYHRRRTYDEKMKVIKQDEENLNVEEFFISLASLGPPSMLYKLVAC